MSQLRGLKAVGCVGSGQAFGAVEKRDEEVGEGQAEREQVRGLEKSGVSGGCPAQQAVCSRRPSPAFG